LASPTRKFHQKRWDIFLKITGIICEYNPLHLGHKKQLDIIRAKNGPESGIVCIMSGNFVQRGAPAAISKALRAKAAVLCGADLVLELPVTAALSSAEGFASEGVRLLSPFCHELCFGAESADADALMAVAKTLLSADFPPALRSQLDLGLSFPAARQAALENLGTEGSLLTQPNNILAVEYCKAILAQNSSIQPFPILRQGSYHDTAADPENPSATSLRQLMENDGNWLNFVPKEAHSVFKDAVFYTKRSGERAILAKLRTMTDAEFEAVPYGSEGLWRKLMHAARRESTVEDIACAVKSKRYTRSRIDRMILCAFLGLTVQELQAPAPYARVLAFNDKGREILKTARNHGFYPNIGEKLDDPYQKIENRCSALYGLLAADTPTAPNTESTQRIYYHH
jgi:predicted nucleotidyltransferase